MLTLLDFVAALRREISHGIEYSLSADPKELGVMVAGGELLKQHFLELTRSAEFTDTWITAVTSFCERLEFTNFLFKVDWNQDRARAVSFYGHLADHVTARDMETVFTAVKPTMLARSWPCEIARLLGMSRPEGFGLRIDGTRRLVSAMYYNLNQSVRTFAKEKVNSLVRMCGFQESVSLEIMQALPRLYTTPQVGVIGIDADEHGQICALKLDPEFVSLQRAADFAIRTGTTPTRIHAIAAWARDVHATDTSYFGVKYTNDGFAGWKMYFYVRPDSTTSALETKIYIKRRRPLA